MRRSQQGFSLMEILIAISITSIVLVPLLAWTILAIKQQPVVKDDMVRTASTGLLGTYLPRDVAAAGSAAKSGEDCIGGEGHNGSVRLVLLTGGAADTKIVYSEAAATPGDGTGPGSLSIWRRVCDAATGQIRDAVEVFEHVVTNSTIVTCSSEDGDAPCRQIDFVTMPASARNADDQVRLRATRRVDYQPPPTDPAVKVPPTAVISVTNRQGTQPLTVDFSADDSIDPDGTIVNYRWEFSLNPVSDSQVVVREGADQSHQQWVFPVAGEYTVWLTVTDDDGLTHTTHRRIATDNQSPVALIDLDRTTGVAGVDEFHFIGDRSYDPDGSVGTYRWVVEFAPTPDNPSGSSFQMTSASASKVFPSEVHGTGVVTLTVIDLQGGVGTETALITVNSAGTGPVDPDPVEGAPVPVIVTSPGGAPRAVSFDGSQSTATDAQIVSYLWTFPAGAQVAGVTTTQTFPAAGVYNVSLTVVDDKGRSATKTQEVTVGGSPTRPGNPWRVGNDLVWKAVPGARRYLVDFEFSTTTGCVRQILDQAVGASASPRKSIPVNPCPKGATAKARVGAEANGEVAYSDWVVITATNTPSPTKPEVVK